MKQDPGLSVQYQYSEEIPALGKMRSYPILLATSAFWVTVGKCSDHPIVIPLPAKNSEPIPKDLQSFSLELAFFPDYAGNKSSPNVFSQNLMENFKDITGVYPKIRVGGTSQYELLPSITRKQFANFVLIAGTILSTSLTKRMVLNSSLQTQPTTSLGRSTMVPRSLNRTKHSAT
jgi:hypothetical protein